MATPGFSFVNFWLLFMLSVFHLTAYYCFSSQLPLCHDDEASALLHFKESLSIDINACADSKVASWKLGREDGDCCSWDGVECDNITSHVIGLHLSSSCLYGSINSSSALFRLFHLKSLDLSGNNFCLSKIPFGISNLSRLTHLNLSTSNFSDQIPSQVFQLSNLVSLNLSYNPLKLQKPGLRDLVETLSNLMYLDLSEVMISSQLPHSLANLTSLSTLFLKNCSLYGEFPVGIFQLPSLHELNVRFNPNLTGYLSEFKVGRPLELLRLDDTSFSGQLPESIGNLRSLNLFTIANCLFSGPIPSSIGNLTKLEVLDFSYNNFLGPIPSSIGNLIELEVLDFSYNNFSGPIPFSLGNLFQLNYLSLSSNNFSPNKLSWVANLTNLNILQLEEINLYGDIPSSMRNLTQLTTLRLYSNKLSGQIPSWLGNFTQLTGLLLANNQFNGPVPESIFKLPNLKNLDLYNNYLKGTLRSDLFFKSKSLLSLQLSKNDLSLIISPTDVNNVIPKYFVLGLNSCNLSEFPSFLRGQDQLVFLVLSQNKIKGQIPDWMSNLSNLEYLDMSSNLLAGFEQPITFLPWANLCIFDLTSNKMQGSLPIPPASISAYLVSNNRFTGEISQLMCNMTYPSVIDLSNNNLIGKIPPCLSNLSSSLLVLNLTNNYFSGNIPDIYRTNCTLRMMDFSQNKLGGKIPRSLANCTKLDYLNLGENQIHDFFPFWLGILPDLKVLALKSNKLYGTMVNSRTKFDFSRLQIIDISDNYLTGKLPVAYFKKWNAMRSVDDNQLEYMETIPIFQTSHNSWSFAFSYSITMENKGIVTEYEKILEFFVAIDLSSNGFQGAIPQAIGNLRGLYSLNLSNNNLTGQIPSSLANLKRLESLDLSKNKLRGQIPAQLAQLDFLAFLNLSYNCLEGPIPRGRHFDTFQNNSYFANSGLCGDPLSNQCVDTENAPTPLPHSSSEQDGGFDSSFKFGLKVVLIGYAIGFVIGIIIECTMSWRKNKWLLKISARMQHNVKSIKSKLWKV